MAQLNITLNQDEILQLLSDDRESAFKKLLQESLNSVLKAELLEPGGIDHPESTRNNQSELIRKSQCTYMAN